MKILIIDTTIGPGSVTLSEDDNVISSIEWEGQARHAEVLADNINKIFKKVGWKINEINGVGAALGPGSFTGLRIGLATAKGIAAANNIPVAGFSTLDALAFCERSFDGIVVSTVDARRKEIYAKAFDFKTDKVIFEAQTFPPEQFKTWLDQNKKPILLIGSGANLYWNLFKMNDVSLNKIEIPDPKITSKIVYEKLKNGGDDLDLLVPEYIRISDAEIGFLGKAGK